MSELKKKRPTSLIQNHKVEPEQTFENTKITTEAVVATAKPKNKNKNQDSNIKLSYQTKSEIDILTKFIDNKFAYETIETMLDYYVENALDADKRRAFKTLASL